MFRPPTDYCCEAVDPVDEQLCALIAKRKDVSGNNPGFPGVDRIAAWCERYGLNEQMIWHVFNQLYHGDRFQPPPVPTGFRRFVPIVKFVKLDGLLYAVTHMKQYANASVVNIEVSLGDDEEETVEIAHARMDLSLGPAYTCWQESGCGGSKGMHYGFTVAPPLPDDVAAVEFSLQITPFPDMPAGPRVSLKAAVVVIK
jgi:hypothetical protein